MSRRAGAPAAGRTTMRCKYSGRFIAVLLTGTLVGCGSSIASTQSDPTVNDPPVFALAQGDAVSPPATTSGNVPGDVGSGPVLQLRSASNGDLERDLADDVGAIALSPDGSTVYYESAAGSLDPFPIDRVSTSGGRPVQVASGEDPAVSPNGTELAYATGGGDVIAVANLTRHTTRLIDLAALIGPGASFSNTPGVVTWLSDTELVTIPPQDATAAAASTPVPTPAGAAATCTAAYNRDQQCAIIIDLNALHPAHLAILTLPRNFPITAAGAGPTTGSLLVGSLGTVTRYAVTADSAARQATTPVPDNGLVEGFSPDGRHVLYLHNHGPVQLWDAPITAHGVSTPTELLANADLGSVSW